MMTSSPDPLYYPLRIHPGVAFERDIELAGDYHAATAVAWLHRRWTPGTHILDLTVAFGSYTGGITVMTLSASAAATGALDPDNVHWSNDITSGGVLWRWFAAPADIEPV